MGEAHSGDVHNRNDNQHDIDGRAEVGLHQYQGKKRAENHERRNDGVAETPDFRLFFDHIRRKIEDENQFGDFRRLKRAKRAKRQPAPGIVDFRADAGNQRKDEQRERKRQEGIDDARPLIDFVGNCGDDSHRRQPDENGNQVAQQKMMLIALLFGVQAAGAIHHDDAERD